MKILTAAQIREADSFTIKNEPVQSIDLMERASRAFTKVFSGLIETTTPVKVICGPGNNGGDGLAIARMLMGIGYTVETFIVKVSDRTSEDFRINYERLNRRIQVKTIGKEEDIPFFPVNQVIIDAIFGSGLSRPAEGLFAKVIKAINQSGANIISVDIASGLFSDKPAQPGAVIEPEYTISFQIPKLAFFGSKNASYVGKWMLTDIGLLPEGIEKQETSHFYTTTEEVKKLIRKRSVFSHKGTFGSAMIIAGSFGKIGAASLCGKACLRSGVGLLTMHIPECGYQIIQSSIPEAMASVDVSLRCFSEAPDVSKYNVVGIGPGLGTNQKTINAMRDLLSQVEGPMVIDADGLNILAKQNEMVQMLPPNSILTPHPKEFERIAGEFANDYEKFELQKEFSKHHQVIIVLKGAYTSISDPYGNLYFNSTGNPGMATGGSGDILTGIITGLLAQQYQPIEAAILGVYLHGLAGDMMAEQIGEEALLPGDMIEMMGAAFQRIHSF